MGVAKSHVTAPHLHHLDRPSAWSNYWPHQERDSSYSDFLATHPPVFADATDPLEVDSWLCTTESKLVLLHCKEYQKTLYAVQQLPGSAGAWWASYIAALPTDHHILWDEFCTAFHAHHLFASLLYTKLKEFLDLEQGNRSVFDYTRQFNTLAQYGSYHVDTDEKKVTSTVKGLPSTCKNIWVFLPTSPTMNWRVPPLIKRS
jgi:hypothetical protein